MLEINLQGSVRLARAAMAVMRPAGYGRIILVGSTGGLHGDVGLSAYAASKGGLLASGRSLAAEGAGQGVLTNMLLPYALTQLTDDGMPASARPRMDPDLAAPVLTALASPECGEYLVTGGGRLRRASIVEWAPSCCRTGRVSAPVSCTPREPGCTRSWTRSGRWGSCRCRCRRRCTSTRVFRR